MRRRFMLYNFVFVSTVFFIVFFFVTPHVFALTPAELQQQINAKQQQKALLDEENKKLQAEIDIAAKQAKTLQGAVKTLDTTAKKLQNDLKVTSNKIDTTTLTVKQLGVEIDETTKSINSNKSAMEETLRSLNQIDDATIIQNFLQYENINDIWSAAESLHQFQTLVKQKTDDLSRLNDQLSEQKASNEAENKKLVSLKTELSTRKTIVDQTKQAKSNLLTVTKNQQSEYARMLQANLEKGRQFEQELFQFESQLKAILDPSKIPTEQSGALSWPVDKVIITQRFGKTVSAKRLYVSGTHNGVDFGVPVGTTIHSVANGTVTGMGNTDEQSGCYSYGRWLLIDHGNGLSSLYAHLSAYNVSMGQQVSRGSVVGYSGGQPGVFGSGYSTGAHLHLGLFATQGVKVSKYTASKFCKNVSIPIVEGLNVYLDPLAYLPPVN